MSREAKRLINLPLSDRERTTIYRDRQIANKLSHTRWAARQYASRLLFRQRQNPSLDVVSDAGGLDGIVRTMATYQVHESLRPWAAKKCLEIFHTPKETA